MVYKSFNNKSSGGGIASEPNYQLSFINQLLENLGKEKFIHHLDKIFGVLI